MFTGLISAVTRVVSLKSGAGGALLGVERPSVFENVAIGESIAVSGVCLTVVAPASGPALFFDLSPETLQRSAFADLAPGSGVNLERSLAAGDLLGGHIVAGHVDGTAEVLAVEKAGDSWTFRFSLPAPLARYTVEKGSIAVDGVSLTVAALGESSFDVAVVPHTFGSTTLGMKKPGERVNIEVDVLGKYVERLLAARFGEARDAREAQDARDERLRSLLTEGS